MKVRGLVGDYCQTCAETLHAHFEDPTHNPRTVGERDRILTEQKNDPNLPQDKTAVAERERLASEKHADGRPEAMIALCNECLRKFKSNGDYDRFRSGDWKNAQAEIEHNRVMNDPHEVANMVMNARSAPGADRVINDALVTDTSGRDVNPAFQHIENADPQAAANAAQNLRAASETVRTPVKTEKTKADEAAEVGIKEQHAAEKRGFVKPGK